MLRRIALVRNVDKNQTTSTAGVASRTLASCGYRVFGVRSGRGGLSVEMHGILPNGAILQIPVEQEADVRGGTSLPLVLGGVG